MKVVETENLTKYYGKIRGIENLNLRVEEGDIFGFLGPNGAGKTTTIRLLLGLIRPTKGKAYIFGKDVAKSSTWIKEHLGYLPGEPGLYPYLTAGEYLDRFLSLRKNINQNGKYHLAQRLNLDLNRRIKGLSHGNKQKVCIIQALMYDVPLLILDEPTSGLDPLVQQEFYRILKEKNRSGKTIFFSSHILSEVEKVCSRVGIVKDGHLVEVAGLHTLIEKRLKVLEAEFSQEVDETKFLIEGVKDVRKDGCRIRLAIRGNFNEILKRLNEYQIKNLTIEDSGLEEIFMEYYEKQDPKV